MSNPNLKEIMEWWEDPVIDKKQYRTPEEMQHAYKWRLNEAMTALKEAVDIFRELEGYDDPMATEWLEKWGME